MQLDKPTLIFVCGWPASGKSALAKKLSEALLVHHVDIDDVRWVAIGKPHPHPNASAELQKRDGQEMGGAYRLLFDTIDWHLGVQRSIICTAALSRLKGQEDLLRVSQKYPEARLRLIQCVPEGDTPEKIKDLFDKRDFGEGGYKGAVNSPERYLEIRNRFEPIRLPHLKVPTWGSGQSVQDECRQALEYICT